MKLVKNDYETNIHSTYDIEKLKSYTHRSLAPCLISSLSEGVYEFVYDISSLNSMVDLKKASMHAKLRCLYSCIQLQELSEIFYFELQPDNLYYDINYNVSIMHRDLISKDKDNILTFDYQMKCLIGYVFTKYSYEDILLGGISLLKYHEISMKVIEMRLDEIESFLFSKIQRLVDDERYQVSMTKINKKNWLIYTSVISILCLLLILGSIFTYMKVIRIHKRRLSSISSFFDAQYLDVILNLNEIATNKLADDELYILALSYIRTSGFQSEAIEVASSQIFHHTNKEYSLFWIYLGRNEFEDAYTIANNYLDTRLLYFAYSVELNYLEVDTKLSITAKEIRRKELSGYIEDYLQEIEQMK